ncbi:hypothetical protein LPW11_02260 [Geomonas sp. RF6]|uniref:hypothetical protein n=1 Tax=Geomonas sp. RF6 TaxID=2897342 RepID=UPI001E3526B0|nr:hypothetical protein [Geomonas sp. RF6]UFS71021.1 hypothetical protein LPW11_02260 [Geomonas sp. RF6]
MHLIQILLPLYDNNGKEFTQKDFVTVRDELTDRFGGITTYVRSPARGLWKETEDSTVQDDIVIYEVMTDVLDRAWWQAYREHLCRAFRQDVLVVRVSEVQLL